MKHKESSKKKPRGTRLTLVVVGLLIAVLGVQLIHVHSQLRAARMEVSDLTMETSRIIKENEALQADLDRADDPDFLEEMAREKLDLAEQGERIFYDVNH